MKVLYFGTYDQNYSRNQIMMAGLRTAGVEVTECHVPLWQGTADKVESAQGGGRLLPLIGRACRAYIALLRAYWPLRRTYDVLMLGYAGQLDVFLARLLTWLAGRPLVLDVFMSLYLIAFERALPARHFLWWVEWLALRLPDALIIDTAEYAAWMEKNYGLPRQRFGLVPTGADSRLFQPLPLRPSDGILRIIYYGTFIPNHGVEYIIEAANLLRAESRICFELIGRGPDRDRAQDLATHYSLTNILFIDWLAPLDLLSHIAAADVCLGVFGMTPQSLMTIQNKIYEGLAVARPVLTGDSPTVRSAMRDREHLYLIERANPRALAEALIFLRDNPDLRAALAHNGHRLFEDNFSVEQLGPRLRRQLEIL